MAVNQPRPTGRRSEMQAALGPGDQDRKLRRDNRMRVRRGRRLQLALFRQLVAMHQNRLADPERIGQMVAARIGRVRMHQDA